MSVGRRDRLPMFRGLRPRTLVLLFAAVAPVLVLLLVWTMNRDLALRRFQFFAAQTATALAAERMSHLFQETIDLAGSPLAARGEGCALSPDLLTRHPDFDAGFLILDKTFLCDGLAPDRIDRLRVRSTAETGPTIGEDGSPDRRLLVAERVESMPDGLLVLRVSRDALDRILRPDETPFLGGVALIGPAGLLAERHRADTPANWWPSQVPAVPKSGTLVLPSAGTDRFDYMVSAIAPVQSIMIAALPTRAFLGSNLWRVFIAFAQATAVLLALVAGAVWSIDRSVLRWIVYLRRIATAHSRGHHSVRAKMAAAPEELVELGRSLNQMANDAARRAALLRDTAQEKGALLLELHHRVKNNFQVITSLLSLHRQDMPPERREEIRFVEDYVRAMAVAYRVAYDSGDVTGVRLQDMLRSVVSALRESTEAPPHRIELSMDAEPIWIDLDKAISLGLYLAAILPPYLKALGDQPVAMLTIVAERRQGLLRLSIGGLAPSDADRPPLRAKLLKAYLRQLKAVPVIANRPHEATITVPLDEPQQAHRLAMLSTTEVELPRAAAIIDKSAATEDIKEREQRMNLLMREMAHRSKNILAVTEAIARQSLAQADSLEDFGKRFSARLHSLAESHDLLTQVEWTGTRLHDLMRSQLGHYLDGSSQVTTEGPDLSLGPLAVPYLGLALHELSTNAAKHGALSVPEGRVMIRWGTLTNADGGERLWLRWAETNGPPVVPPTRRGFGTDVTRRLVARALRGTVTFDFAETGVIWHLDAPASNLVDRRP
ncbi:MAG TPA: sensor histidine kinase [Aliidongia sp.]|uniref:sensor histidine kinase n=1 Tax=Aliidongia sp. TaxID=1914230 RepID=UPI002DDC96CF|nr:sensor histidine kinase [Aliidongia sp.]HEV2677678.1 sensor histidine kinase [Aliidongia sp.]